MPSVLLSTTVLPSSFVVGKVLQDISAGGHFLRFFSSSSEAQVPASPNTEGCFQLISYKGCVSVPATLSVKQQWLWRKSTPLVDSLMPVSARTRDLVVRQPAGQAALLLPTLSANFCGSKALPAPDVSDGDYQSAERAVQTSAFVWSTPQVSVLTEKPLLTRSSSNEAVLGLPRKIDGTTATTEVAPADAPLQGGSVLQSSWLYEPASEPISQAAAVQVQQSTWLYEPALENVVEPPIQQDSSRLYQPSVEQVAQAANNAPSSWLYEPAAEHNEPGSVVTIEHSAPSTPQDQNSWIYQPCLIEVLSADGNGEAAFVVETASPLSASPSEVEAAPEEFGSNTSEPAFEVFEDLSNTMNAAECLQCAAPLESEVASASIEQAPRSEYGAICSFSAEPVLYMSSLEESASRDASYNNAGSVLCVPEALFAMSEANQEPVLYMKQTEFVHLNSAQHGKCTDNVPYFTSLNTTSHEPIQATVESFFIKASPVFSNPDVMLPKQVIFMPEPLTSTVEPEAPSTPPAASMPTNLDCAYTGPSAARLVESEVPTVGTPQLPSLEQPAVGAWVETRAMELQEFEPLSIATAERAAALVTEEPAVEEAANYQQMLNEFTEFALRPECAPVLQELPLLFTAEHDSKLTEDICASVVEAAAKQQASDIYQAYVPVRKVASIQDPAHVDAAYVQFAAPASDAFIAHVSELASASVVEEAAKERASEQYHALSSFPQAPEDLPPQRLSHSPAASHVAADECVPDVVPCQEDVMKEQASAAYHVFTPAYEPPAKPEQLDPCSAHELCCEPVPESTPLFAADAAIPEHEPLAFLEEQAKEQASADFATFATEEPARQAMALAEDVPEPEPVLVTEDVLPEQAAADAVDARHSALAPHQEASDTPWATSHAQINLQHESQRPAAAAAAAAQDLTPTQDKGEDAHVKLECAAAAAVQDPTPTEAAQTQPAHQLPSPAVAAAAAAVLYGPTPIHSEGERQRGEQQQHSSSGASGKHREEQGQRGGWYQSFLPPLGVAGAALAVYLLHWAHSGQLSPAEQGGGAEAELAAVPVARPSNDLELMLQAVEEFDLHLAALRAEQHHLNTARRRSRDQELRRLELNEQVESLQIRRHALQELIKDVLHTGK